MNLLFVKIINMSIVASLLLLVIMAIRLAWRKRMPGWLSKTLWAVAAVALICPYRVEAPVGVWPRFAVFVEDAASRKGNNKLVEGNANANNQQGEGNHYPVTRPDDTNVPDIKPTSPVGQPTMPEKEPGSDVEKQPTEGQQGSKDDNQQPEGSRPDVKPEGGTSNPDKEAEIQYPEKLGKTENFTGIITILSSVWVGGIVILFLWSGLEYWRLKKKLQESVAEGSNIRNCDYIQTPFVFGILRPCIYVPSTLEGEDKEFALMHERMHIKHGDFLLKPLGFAVAVIHWFNPLVWAAFFLFGKDLEYACDESAIKDMSQDEKKRYMGSLLNCSMNNSGNVAYPLGFGEKDVMKRIEKITHYKKQSATGIILGILLCVCLTGCFFTEKKSSTSNESNGANPTEPDTVSPSETVTVTPTLSPEAGGEKPTQAPSPTEKPVDVRGAVMDILVGFKPYERECLNPDLTMYQDTLTELAEYGKAAPYFMAEYVLRNVDNLKCNDLMVMAAELMKSENMLGEAGSFCLFESEYRPGNVKWFADQLQKYYAKEYRDVLPAGTSLTLGKENYIRNDPPTEWISEYSQTMDDGEKTYPELTAKQLAEWTSLLEQYKKTFRTEYRFNLMELVAYYRVIGKENATFPVVAFLPEEEVDKLPNGNWKMLGWAPAAEAMNLQTPVEMLENRWYTGIATAKQMEELMTNYGVGTIRLVANWEVSDSRMPSGTAELYWEDGAEHPELLAMFYEFHGDVSLGNQGGSLTRFHAVPYPQ